jgi:hypothetical protein
MKQSKLINRLLTVVALSLTSLIAFAQINPGDDDPGGTPQGWVPIDGGIAALLAVGIGYGAKKAYDYRSKRQANSSNKMD